MADRTLTERLQPSLLDRLTDLQPDKATEGREDRVIDMRRLREIIQRDLAWLLNTNNHDNEWPEGRWPHASNSVWSHPAPTPRIVRPGASQSSVAHCLANCIGLR